MWNLIFITIYFDDKESYNLMKIIFLFLSIQIVVITLIILLLNFLSISYLKYQSYNNLN